MECRYTGFFRKTCSQLYGCTSFVLFYSEKCSLAKDARCISPMAYQNDTESSTICHILLLTDQLPLSVRSPLSRTYPLPLRQVPSPWTCYPLPLGTSSLAPPLKKDPPPSYAGTLLPDPVNQKYLTIHSGRAKSLQIIHPS